MKTESVQEIKEAQDDTESGKESVGFGWIITGYIVALIGGVLGTVYGAILYTSKKTLPNGNRGYRYNATDRKNAKIIMILGIATTIIFSAIGMFSEQVFVGKYF